MTHLLVVFVEDVWTDFFEFRFVESGGKILGVGHVEHEHRRPDGHRQIGPEREIGRVRLQDHLGSQDEVEDEVGRRGHDDADEGDDGADGRRDDELFLLPIHRFPVAAHADVRHPLFQQILIHAQCRKVAPS